MNTPSLARSQPAQWTRIPNTRHELRCGGAGATPTDFGLPASDPRVRELDNAASHICADLSEAIETAARQGVPVEVIATYTGKPVLEVELVISEMHEQEQTGPDGGSTIHRLTWSGARPGANDA